MILFLLAQASTVNEVVPFLDFINLGVIVVVLYAVLTKKLVPGWAYEEKSTKVEELEEQVNQLRDKIQDEILPQLFETTSVLGKVAEIQHTLRPTRPLKAD